MKSNIRFFMLLIMIIMFLVIIPPTFAVDITKDDVNTDTKEAINRLKAFDIVEGREDGKYHPEDNITREELVKIVVKLLGYENTSSLFNQNPKFNDVEKDSWSSNYINIAVGSGLVSGYGDGTFKPKKNVTFSEGITIVLRSIGYRDMYLQGQWPSNYIVKAAEMGLLKGISLKYDEDLNRGQVALIINRILEENMLSSIEGGSKTVISDKTLMEEELGLYKLENVEILGTENIRDNQVVNVRFNGDISYNGYSFDKNEQEHFKITDDSLVMEGEYINIYVNKDKEIIYTDHIGMDNDAVQGAENHEIVNGYTDKPFNKIKLSSMDKFLDIDDSANIYINSEKINKRNYDKYLRRGQAGLFSVKDDSLTYGKIFDFDSKNLYVNNVNVEEGVVEFIDAKNGDKGRIDFENNGYDVYLLNNSGKKHIKYSDIKKGDIINTIKGDNRDIMYVLRYRKVGVLGKVKGGINGYDISITLKNINGELRFADEFIYSYNNGEKIDNIKDRTVYGARVLQEFYNQNVKLSTDLKGDIVYIEGNLNIKLGLYGVLVRYGDALDGEIQIYGENGKRKVYAFEDYQEYDRLKEYTDRGNIIKYSIGKSGKLKNMSSRLENDVFETFDTKKILAGDDFGEDYIIIDDNKYKVDNDTVIFDYTGHNPYSVKVIKWNTLKNNEVLEDVEVIMDEEDGVLKMLTIWDNINGIQNKMNIGYVIDSYNLGEDRYADIRNSEGKVLTYKISKDNRASVVIGRVILYQLNGGNQLEISPIAKVGDFKTVSGTVTSIDSRYIEVGNEIYRLDDNAEVFRYTDDISLSKISRGDLVTVGIEEDKVKMIELSGTKFGNDLEDGKLLDIDFDGTDIIFTIEVDGDEIIYYGDENVDYIIDNDYIDIDDIYMSTTEAFMDYLGSKEPYIRFYYDDETSTIYDIFVK
ncbi:S-layer homology domain-containing protein [Dethiothermospora halolimnae]|uniref:S-layer homology domain-containing protein n=1 Tax=Dethiothermospora halolimnae TaxID=3114390 RepID=UPI003CCC312A